MEGEELISDDVETCYTVFEKNYNQPLMQDWGAGEMDFLWKSLDDAKRFLEAYMQQYGVTDPSMYRFVEFEVADQLEADELVSTYWLEETDASDEEGVETEQADFQDLME